MAIKIKKHDYPKYICPFCKTEVKSSSKTEIFYRAQWINGCFNCFALSINELTSVDFQSSNY